MYDRPPCPELEEKVKQLEKKIAAFKNLDRAFKECEDQFQALLNATTDCAILMDSRGTILAMNEAGARRLGKEADEVIGQNVYGLISPAVAKDRKTKLAAVLRSGKPLCFRDERDGLIFDHTIYPVKNDHGEVTKIAVYARDITRRKQAEARLRERESALKIEKQELEEVNTALKVLLTRTRQDKAEWEEKVLANVRNLVMPYVQRLKEGPLNPRQKSYLDTLESNLAKIVSPFAYTLSSKFTGFTPREIQIAKLVKNGKTAKDIGELLCMSVRTVESHKKSIRKKIHIQNSKINLRSHLSSV
jgi:PAS domain S-box-containing protein